MVPAFPCVFSLSPRAGFPILLVGCSGPAPFEVLARTPQAEPAATVVASAAPAPAPAVDPDPGECFAEVRSESRVEDCKRFLDESEAGAAKDPSHLPEELADAIRRIWQRGGAVTLGVHEARAMTGRYDHCVTVNRSPRVESLMCRAAICGDPADWFPVQFARTTGRLSMQPC